MLCEVGVCGMVSSFFVLFGFAAYWQLGPQKGTGTAGPLVYVSTALSGCGGSSERLAVIEERNGKILCCLKVEWVVVSCYVKSVLVFKRSMAIVLGVITQPWFWTCWWEGSSGGCIPTVSRMIPSSCRGNLQLETVPAVFGSQLAQRRERRKCYPQK